MDSKKRNLKKVCKKRALKGDVKMKSTETTETTRRKVIELLRAAQETGRNGAVRLILEHYLWRDFAKTEEYASDSKDG